MYVYALTMSNSSLRILYTFYYLSFVNVVDILLCLRNESVTIKKANFGVTPADQARHYLLLAPHLVLKTCSCYFQLNSNNLISNYKFFGTVNFELVRIN